MKIIVSSLLSFCLLTTYLFGQSSERPENKKDKTERLFVTVGHSGTILTSSDGTSWTERTSGTSMSLRGVTYGKGLFVTVDDNQNFQYTRQPLSNLELIGHLESLYETGLVTDPVPFPGTRIEINLEACKVMSAISEIVENGYIFVSDYGYITEELYASWRTTGTLMAFRKQNVEPDLFRLPGLTDITAHVDFGSLVKATKGAWHQQGLVSQAETMLGLGLYEMVNSDTSCAKANPERFLILRQAAERLCDPSGLGRIRVLVLSKSSSKEDLMCLSKVLA